MIIGVIDNSNYLSFSI